MPAKKEKSESDKLKDFGAFVRGIVDHIDEEVAKGRKRIQDESTKVEPIPDAIAAALGLRSQTAPTTAQRAKKPARKATVRKNGSR